MGCHGYQGAAPRGIHSVASGMAVPSSSWRSTIRYPRSPHPRRPVQPHPVSDVALHSRRPAAHLRVALPGSSPCARQAWCVLPITRPGPRRVWSGQAVRPRMELHECRAVHASMSDQSSFMPLDAFISWSSITCGRLRACVCLRVPACVCACAACTRTEPALGGPWQPTAREPEALLAALLTRRAGVRTCLPSSAASTSRVWTAPRRPRPTFAHRCGAFQW
jgi:hypothetical protein